MKKLLQHNYLGVNAIVSICCLLVLILGIAFASRAQAASQVPMAGQRLITVHDQGQDRGILTHATSLRAAFKEANIRVDPNDMVEPGLDETLASNNYEVNIYRARPVTIIDGTVSQKVMSPYQTAKQIAKQAHIVLHDEDIANIDANTDMVAEGAGVSMTIKRATAFTLVLYGTKTTAYTQAKTVDEMLNQKGIKLAKDDTLSVAKTAAMQAGMTIELWRNGKQTATEEQDVAFETEQIKDADQPVGYKKIQTPGVLGKKTVSYEIEMKNGQEVSRKEIQSVVTAQPSKQVEVVGMKFKYTGGPLSEVQINALGMCESGMTANRNSGNGFYGAFQFTYSTWLNYNKTFEYASDAPLDVQKQAVQDLLSHSSIYSQFPACAKKMQSQGIL